MRCVAAGHVDYNVNVATEGEVEETPEGESSPHVFVKTDVL